MKLLLTSAGLKNNTITDELCTLVGKSLKRCNAVYVQTAANPNRGDKSWLIANLDELTRLFSAVDITDVAWARDYWWPALRDADVIVVGGGNTTYLMQQMRASGADKTIHALLPTTVYVGISAGSIIATPATAPNTDGMPTLPALSLVAFGIQPHYLAKNFPPAATNEVVRQRLADNGITYPVYAIDDQSAISVTDNVVQVVSEGDWHLFQ